MYGICQFFDPPRFLLGSFDLSALIDLKEFTMKVIFVAGLCFLTKLTKFLGTLFLLLLDKDVSLCLQPLLALIY